MSDTRKSDEAEAISLSADDLVEETPPVEIVEFEEAAATVPAPDAGTPGEGAGEDDVDTWALEASSWLHPHEKNSDTPQKVSALFTAILVHAGVILLLGLVIISIPPPNPPQLVASVAPMTEDVEIDDVQIQKIARAASSAAPSQPTLAISSMGISNVAIPEFDQNQSLDVTVGEANYDIGIGMSFSADDSESVVNFFGIRSKGKRIAFIIDAEKYMLTDNKGGIPAYNKVKDEIGRMLAGLNRDTAFNLLIYEGRRLSVFREELVAATPSTVRLGIEWLTPLNQEFENLGIRSAHFNAIDVQSGIEPIPQGDITGYPKAIQACLEMDVHTVFIIASGWRHMHRTPTEEEKADMAKLRKRVWDEKKQAKMEEARVKAQEWLRKENEERKKKGVPQKVITSLWPIMRQVMPGVEAPPQFRGHSMEEVEEHIKNGVKSYYQAYSKPKPEINLVWFIGEDETPSLRVEEHFKNLTRRNRGKLKILEGLAAIEDVTGR